MGRKNPRHIRGAQAPEGITGKFKYPVPEGQLAFPGKYAVVSTTFKVLGGKFKAIMGKETNSPSTSHRNTQFTDTLLLNAYDNYTKEPPSPYSMMGKLRIQKSALSGKDRVGTGTQVCVPATTQSPNPSKSRGFKEKQSVTRRETFLKLISPRLQKTPLPWRIKNKQSLLSVCCKLPATCIKEVHVNHLRHSCHGQNYYPAKRD